MTPDDIKQMRTILHEQMDAINALQNNCNRMLAAIHQQEKALMIQGISDDTRKKYYELAHKEGRIKAIKAYRNEFDCGLKAGHDAIVAIAPNSLYPGE